jgi:hypothetical protein
VARNHVRAPMGRAQACSRSSQDRRAGSVTPSLHQSRRPRKSRAESRHDGAGTRVQVILARSPCGERYPVAPPLRRARSCPKTASHPTSRAGHAFRDHALLPVRRPGWARVTVNHHAAGSNPATGANHACVLFTHERQRGHRLLARIPDSLSGGAGSIPAGPTNCARNRRRIRTGDP